jgi:hypothetical protein
MSETTDFAGLTEGLAIRFWGKPTSSTKAQHRWGSGGSRSFNITDMVWFDHEAGKGGGAIELVMRECSTDRSGALAWMEKEGLIDARHVASAVHQRQEAPKPSNEPAEAEKQSQATPKAVKGYRYTDRDGNPLYEVIRYQFVLPDGTIERGKDGNPKKTFRQRRPDGRGGYIWNLEGIGHTIYRHPEVERAIERKDLVILVEGEKDVETVEALGFVATTNSGGAQHWTDDMARHLAGADVVVIPDNDDAGRAGAEKKAESLKAVANSVRILDLARYWDAPPKSDVTDWISAGGTLEELTGILAGTIRPRPPRSTFGAQTSGDLARKPVVYDWLVKHLIERNGIMILAGESMAGKSFLIMDMGMKVARGLDYAGHKVRQGAVIHMAVEDGKGTELRFKGCLKAQGISPDADVPYVVMDPFANGGMGFTLMADDVVDRFIAECLEWKAHYGSLELIIIDTLSMATEGMDENSSGEASKVLGRINRIRERTGATVAVVHHMNAGGTKVRGSTAIVANVPNVIELRQQTIPAPNRHTDPKPALDGNGQPIRRARLAKNKNGVGNKSWAFVLEQVTLDDLDEDGEPFTTMVCARPAKHSQHDQPEQEAKLQGGNKLVFDALTAAMVDLGQDMPSDVKAGSVARCVAQSAFVGEVRKRMSFKAPEEEQEARQKELADFLSRTTMALMNAGYMGRDNDKRIVWATGKSDRPRQRYQEQERPPEQPGAGISEEVKQEIADSGVPF